MLKFLKKIFVSKEIERVEVPLKELEAWFEERSKFVYKDLDDALEVIKSKIKEEIRKCHENLEKLEKAELKNPNIPMRAKQAMEGNREAYTRRVKLFLDGIYLKHNNYDNILEFCEGFDKQLNDFAKSTLKSYQILQEFLAHESSDVAGNIRTLDESVKKLKQAVRDSRLEDTEKMKKAVLDLKNKVRRKGSLEIEISSKGKALEEEKKNKEDLQEKIEKFRKSEAYLNYNKLLDNKEAVKKEIYDHRSSVSQSFSVLEKAFKKFSRIAFEDSKLVESYTESPIKTLIEDRDLKIVKIMGSMEKSLNDGKLGLDEKKKKKSLNEIKVLDKNFFVGFLKKHGELKGRLSKVDKEIARSDVEYQHDEMKDELDKVDDKLEKSSKDLEDLQGEFGKIDIQKMKENLQNGINSLLDIELTIS